MYTEPNPYDMLMETIKHVEQLSEAMVIISNHHNQSTAEIAKLRADLNKLTIHNTQLAKAIQEIIRVNS